LADVSRRLIIEGAAAAIIAAAAVLATFLIYQHSDSDEPPARPKCSQAVELSVDGGHPVVLCLGMQEDDSMPAGRGRRGGERGGPALSAAAPPAAPEAKPTLDQRASLSGLDEALEGLGIEDCREEVAAILESARFPLQLDLDRSCNVLNRRDGVITGRLSITMGIPIDVNLAAESDLEAIDGIGLTVAAEIVAERRRGGQFCSTADLASRVKGIGPAKLASWEGSIVASCPQP